MKRSTMLLWLAAHFAALAVSTQLLAYSIDHNIYNAARFCWLVCIGTGASFGWLARGFADWRKAEQLKEQAEQLSKAREAFEVRYQRWVRELEQPRPPRHGTAWKQ